MFSEKTLKTPWKSHFFKKKANFYPSTLLRPPISGGKRWSFKTAISEQAPVLLSTAWTVGEGLDGFGGLISWGFGPQECPDRGGVTECCSKKLVYLPPFPRTSAACCKTQELTPEKNSLKTGGKQWDGNALYVCAYKTPPIVGLRTLTPEQKFLWFRHPFGFAFPTKLANWIAQFGQNKFCHDVNRMPCDILVILGGCVNSN